MGKKYIHPFYNKFTNVKTSDDVIRTYGFGLEPVDGTKFYLSGEDSYLIEDAELLESSRKEAQEVFDKFCKKMIDDTFSNITNDNVRELFEVEGENDDEVSNKRRVIVESWFDKWFTDDKNKHFTIAYLIRKLDEPNSPLREVLDNLTEKELESFAVNKNKSVAFTAYNISRDTTFKTNIPKRVAVENFSIFLKNILSWKNLDEEIKNTLATLVNVNELVSDVTDLSDIFSEDYYINCLKDEDIVRYNTIIGGRSLEDGVKIKGINEVLNELFSNGNITEKIKFKKLQSQILSDNSSLSFVPYAFINDEEFIDDTYKDFTNRANNLIPPNELSLAFSNVCLGEIIFPNSGLRELSRWYFNQYDYIINTLENNNKKLLKRDYFTLEELVNLCGMEKIVNKFIDKYTLLYDDLQFALLRVPNKQVFVKSVLDKTSEELLNPIYEALVGLERLLNLFYVDLNDVKMTLPYNKDFYVFYSDVSNVLEGSGKFNGKITSFLTRKLSDDKNTRLYFGCDSLAHNVSESKDRESKVLFFRKYVPEMHRYDYFLAIISNRCFSCASKYFNKEGFFSYGVSSTMLGENDYEKFVFQQLGKASWQIPRLFFDPKYPLIDKKALDIYNHKKAGLPITKEELTILIDYLINTLKREVKERDKWSIHRANYKSAEEYASYEEFLNDVSANMTSMTYKYMSEETMNELVNSGNLYLFKFSGKGFTSSLDKKAINIVALKEFFSDNNIQLHNIIIGADSKIYYRPAKIEKQITHPKGSLTVHKIDKNGVNLNDTGEYMDIVNATQGLSIEEAEQLYPDVGFGIAPIDLIKDNRYTHEQFSIDICFKFLSSDNVPKLTEYGFNSYVNDTFANVPREELRLIGVDRGERNFVTLTILDGWGKQLDRKSLNILGGTDFHKRTNCQVAEKKKAQKARKASVKIKDLKKDWCTKAVSYIIEKMLKHPSIIVLESLHPSFTGSPKGGTDNRVYGIFLKALVSKLSFFFDQYAEQKELGSVTNPLVLCNKNYTEINSIISKKYPVSQFGFLLFVDPYYTSKIDVLTGFYNFFDKNDLSYKNIKASQKFFSKFDSIHYNLSDGSFRFLCSPSKFKKKYPDVVPVWEFTSSGLGRTYFSKKDRRYISVDITTELKNLFLENGIDFIGGENLVKEISKIDSKEFFVSFYFNLKLMFALRYSNDKEDFILSPVIRDDVQYDTRNNIPGLPICGDTNGSFMIGQKALFWMNERASSIDSSKKADFKFDNFILNYQKDRLCKPAS